MKRRLDEKIASYSVQSFEIAETLVQNRILDPYDYELWRGLIQRYFPTFPITFSLCTWRVYRELLLFKRNNAKTTDIDFEEQYPTLALNQIRRDPTELPFELWKEHFFPNLGRRDLLSLIRVNNSFRKKIQLKYDQLLTSRYPGWSKVIHTVYCKERRPFPLIFFHDLTNRIKTGKTFFFLIHSKEILEKSKEDYQQSFKEMSDRPEEITRILMIYQKIKTHPLFILKELANYYLETKTEISQNWALLYLCVANQKGVLSESDLNENTIVKFSFPSEDIKPLLGINRLPVEAMVVFLRTFSVIISQIGEFRSFGRPWLLKLYKQLVPTRLKTQTMKREDLIWEISNYSTNDEKRIKVCIE